VHAKQCRIAAVVSLNPLCSYACKLYSNAHQTHQARTDKLTLEHKAETDRLKSVLAQRDARLASVEAQLTAAHEAMTLQQVHVQAAQDEQAAVERRCAALSSGIRRLEEVGEVRLKQVTHLHYCAVNCLLSL
jgi:chromosome segregation ATPase